VQTTLSLLCHFTLTTANETIFTNDRLCKTKHQDVNPSIPSHPPFSVHTDFPNPSLFPSSFCYVQRPSAVLLAHNVVCSLLLRYLFILTIHSLTLVLRLCCSLFVPDLNTAFVHFLQGCTSPAIVSLLLPPPGFCCLLASIAPWLLLPPRLHRLLASVASSPPSPRFYCFLAPIASLLLLPRPRRLLAFVSTST
jgi:hypothetical protein